MRTFECPSCGAAVNFSSGAAVFAVCQHCSSMVVRSDIALETIGTAAALPPDLSPFQLGTTGEWRGRAFTLRGRIRLAWAEGSWTEWFLEFSDGKEGWLGETQGFFTISFLNDKDAAPHKLVPPGETLAFARRHWRLIDRKETRCIGSEGELPFVAKPGAKRVSADLLGTNGEFGTLEQHDGAASKFIFYEGAFAEFSELNFKNLRPVPGWDIQPHEPVRRTTRTLNCPTCAAQVTLRAEGLTMSVVCGSCGTILDVSQEEVQKLQAAHKAIHEIKPLLPLGRRGEFRGIQYEVIGVAIRKDSYARWSEYLLFNPWHGFAWLVTFNGHWSFVRRLLRPLTFRQQNDIAYDGRSYALFARYEAEVTAVLGEFYWQTSRGERAHLNDYIAPPHVLSREVYPGLTEETWSAGEYVTPEEVTRAFTLETPLTSPSGPYLNEPNPYAKKTPSVLLWSIAGLLALLIIHGIFLALRPEREVFSASFTYDKAAADHEVTTASFKLTGGPQPLGFTAWAGVDNSWIDFDAELVNSATGATIPISLGVSYYHGRDNDGPWAEGSTSAITWIPAVPAGEYFLRLDPTADPNNGSPPLTTTPLSSLNARPVLTSPMLPFGVRILHGGVFHTNLLLCLLLIAIYPAWVFWRRQAFEARRWAESDFSGSDD